jgi:transcriptional antiterminator NusG
MSKRWYVVHAYSGFEKSVQRALSKEFSARECRIYLGRCWFRSKKLSS